MIMLDVYSTCMYSIAILRIFLYLNVASFDNYSVQSHFLKFSKSQMNVLVYTTEFLFFSFCQDRKVNGTPETRLKQDLLKVK